MNANRLPRAGGTAFAGIVFRMALGCGLILAWIGPAVAQESPSAKYLGERNCRHCHGTAEWTRMEQYLIWHEKDAHSRSFAALRGPLSREIARWMALPEERPEEWGKCIRCHLGETDPSARGPHYTLEEGVSCEACHGRAEHWLAPHVLFDATHSTNVAHGMTDLKDLVTRARVCLSCHGGLDHEIVAAGHPDLSFELLHDSFWQPPHWNYKEASPFAFWAVGQAVAVELALRRLSTAEADPTTGKNLHVEAFDDVACFRCHQKLIQDRWRNVEGHFSVLRPLIERLAPGESTKRLVEAVERIGSEIDPHRATDRAQLRGHAEAAAKSAEEVARSVARLASSTPSEDQIHALIEEIAKPVPMASDSAFPSPHLPTAWVVRYFDLAEQKTLALKCLTLALTHPGSDTPLLAAGVRSEHERAASEERLAETSRALDALWGFVESPTPEVRARRFRGPDYNAALLEAFRGKLSR